MDSRLDAPDTHQPVGLAQVGMVGVGQQGLEAATRQQRLEKRPGGFHPGLQAVFARAMGRTGKLPAKHRVVHVRHHHAAQQETCVSQHLGRFGHGLQVEASMASVGGGNRQPAGELAQLGKVMRQLIQAVEPGHQLETHIGGQHQLVPQPQQLGHHRGGNGPGGNAEARPGHDGRRDQQGMQRSSRPVVGSMSTQRRRLHGHGLGGMLDGLDQGTVGRAVLLAELIERRADGRRMHAIQETIKHLGQPALPEHAFGTAARPGQPERGRHKGLDIRRGLGDPLPGTMRDAEFFAGHAGSVTESGERVAVLQ